MRWMVLLLAGMFVMVGLLLVRWTQPPPLRADSEAQIAAPLPTAQPAARPTAKRPTPEPKPARSPDPITATPEPEARPAPAIQTVAVAPPPLPDPEPQAAPAKDVERTASLTPRSPAESRVVWADEVRAEVTQDRLAALRLAAHELPTDASAEERSRLAGELGETGQHDVQLSVLAGGVRSDPEALQPRIAYGAALMRHEMWAQAAAQWQSVLARAPEHPYAWHNLALAHQETGALGEAVLAWDQALRLAPDNLEGYAHRGRLHLDREDWQSALTDFHVVLQGEPDAPDALLNGALAAANAGDIAQARTWCWHATQRWSQEPRLVATAVERLLQIALLSEQRDPRAEQLAEQLLSREEGTERIRTLLAALRE